MKKSELALEFVKLEKKLAAKHQDGIAKKTKVSMITVWRWIKGVTKPSERDENAIEEWTREEMLQDAKAMKVIVELIVERYGQELDA